MRPCLVTGDLGFEPRSSVLETDMIDQTTPIPYVLQLTSSYSSDIYNRHKYRQHNDSRFNHTSQLSPGRRCPIVSPIIKVPSNIASTPSRPGMIVAPRATRQILIQQTVQNHRHVQDLVASGSLTKILSIRDSTYITGRHPGVLSPWRDSNPRPTP